MMKLVEGQRKWQTKIIDFGISGFSIIDAKIMTDLGSTFWAAPEITIGDTYDSSIDIYSFGVILWQMIEGKSDSSSGFEL